jgi:hypothetical protein
MMTPNAESELTGIYNVPLLHFARPNIVRIAPPRALDSGMHERRFVGSLSKLKPLGW